MTVYSTSIRASINSLLQKYGTRDKDGELTGSLSLAKMYADGSTTTRVKPHRVDDDSSSGTSFAAEDRKKLNGVLTLADLNQHRLESGKTTTLSDQDFEVLRGRTEENFSTYITDPEMNLRRNRYLMAMAETIQPESTEQEPQAEPAVSASA